LEQLSKSLDEWQSRANQSVEMGSKMSNKRDEAGSVAKVRYVRNGGEERFVTKRNEMKLSKLIQLAKAQFGFDDVRIESWAQGKDPMVIGLSEYKSNGESYICAIFSRGKYPGNDAANIYRKN
jgi:hypothetical protein